MAVLKKYAYFSGRARRREYWMFALVSFVISCVLAALGTMFKPFSILPILYTLAVLIPSLAVGWRRLHDTGRSGWWVLVALVPVIGAIVLLVFMCLDSQPGDYQWGPNPKSAVVDAAPA